ncbi:MAG: permease [Candidatus Margulisiibacteriota bacterium]
MFKLIADWLVFSVFQMDPASRWSEVLNFFIYDTLKILVLMMTVVFVVALVRSFFPPQKIKEILSHEKWGLNYLTAAFFGVLSPFCSCSAIPIFLGIIEAQAPLGVAFTFLITSPLVNEVALGIMVGTFGWKIALLYAVSGITLGMLAGAILGRLNLQKELILRRNDQTNEGWPDNNIARIKFAAEEVYWIVRKMFWFVVGGVAVGALIHGLVPAEFFANYLGKGNWWAVPLAVLVGVPIYAGCSTVVPVVFAFVTKGVPLGTALAFMMAVAGLSLPEALILKGSMSYRLLAIFYVLVAIGIILIGYLFNFIL